MKMRYKILIAVSLAALYCLLEQKLAEPKPCLSIQQRLSQDSLDLNHNFPLDNLFWFL